MVPDRQKCGRMEWTDDAKTIKKVYRQTDKHYYRKGKNYISPIYFLPGGIIRYGSFMLTKHLFVLINIRNKDEIGTIKHVKFSIKFLTDHSKADLLCILFFRFFFMSCLFLATLWLPAGKGLTSWLSSM